MKSFLWICCLTLACGSSLKLDEASEKKALIAADNWIKLVDDAQYGASWDTAADLFKKSLTKEKWEEMVKTVRDPLGKSVSRNVKSTEFKTSLPGSVDGEYLIITYTSSFENKKESIETIVPMKDKDGEWRVSGYFIR